MKLLIIFLRTVSYMLGVAIIIPFNLFLYEYKESGIPWFAYILNFYGLLCILPYAVLRKEWLNDVYGVCLFLIVMLLILALFFDFDGSFDMFAFNVASALILLIPFVSFVLYRLKLRRVM